jgi:C-terminal processing protease CtpA/Prc
VQNVIKFTTAEEVDPTTGKTKPRAAVRMTLARLLSPSGNPISGVGITPDTIERDASRQLEIAYEQARELARRNNPRMLDMPR